ncbi:adenosine deaminase [Corynebacterium sp.]|uniref:adenosine deaminase family protein n=1 Tax=Corynebacterium sp. TaxID=1720 RepID=UPI0037350267
MHDAPQISPEHKHVDRETVAQLPKALLHDHLDLSGATTVAEVTAAAARAAEELAADNVVYAELRVRPVAGDVDAAAVLDAVAAGFDAHIVVDARIIVTADRDVDPVAQWAQVCVDKLGGRVVGFDLAGPEDESLAPHAETLRMLRKNYVPVTVHAGATEGMDRIREAVDHGAVRLGHGARIFDDFQVSLEGIGTGAVSTWVRDRGLVLELCPTQEVRAGVVDDLADHPLTLLQQMGFACTVNVGDRSVTSLTDELMRLVETFDYGFDELFDVTVTAVNGAFCGKERREEILATRILPAYEELAGDFNEDVEFGL